MGLFNLFSPKAAKPYKNDGLNNIYELLFCDNINAYTAAGNANTYPWTVLLAAEPNTDQLYNIASDTNLETRSRIIAFRLLTARGVPVSQKDVLGVIIEVALPG